MAKWSMLLSHTIKVLLLMAGPLRGGVKGPAIKEKKIFFQHSKVPTAIKLEGGWGLGLNGPAIKYESLKNMPKV